LATTCAPYQEKINSALMASALDLKRELTTADFGHSLRAATGAFKSALDRFKSGSGKTALVTSADCRQGYPRSDHEQSFGDGAAAVLVGTRDLLATFEGEYTICNEMGGP
jgi:hydroxymethylglutaryl-CoA synthase